MAPKNDTKTKALSQHTGKDGTSKAPSKSKSSTNSESRWESISSNLKTIAGAVLLALVIRTVLFEAFEIEGPSMEPTLLNGDRVVVAKFFYGLFLPFQQQSILYWGQPKRGDVVIIKSPADNVDIVKRVIGLPGDTVEIKKDVIISNGVRIEITDEGPCTAGRGKNRAPRCRVYISKIDDQTFETSGVPLFQNRLPLRVPSGHVYVLGDHRDSSNDSRSIGMIPLNRLKGKALAIYWSNGTDGLRWGRMFTPVH